MKALIFFCILLNMATGIWNFALYAGSHNPLNFGSGIVSMLAMSYIAFVLGKAWDY